MNRGKIAAISAGLLVSAASPARAVDIADILGWQYLTPTATEITSQTPFAACGVLERGPQTCLMLHTDDGMAYAVENTGAYWEGDYVYVSGVINWESWLCFPLITVAIENNTIQACFSGCGLLERGPQTCLILHADSGEAYPVDNTGEFWEGDYVHVRGPINEESLLCFPLITTAIEDNTISACFSGCGILHRGPQTCMILEADSGQGYAIENTDGFWEGDYVHVRGPLNEESWLCSPLIGPGIEDNTIEACDAGPCPPRGRSLGDQPPAKRAAQ